MVESAQVEWHSVHRSRESHGSVRDPDVLDRVRPPGGLVDSVLLLIGSIALPSRRIRLFMHALTFVSQTTRVLKIS